MHFFRSNYSNETKAVYVLVRGQARLYAKKPISKRQMNPSKEHGMHVHEETLRYIDKKAKINIASDILLRICSADVQEYPNSDVLIASLNGSHSVKNATAAMHIEISDDDKNVDIKIEKLHSNSDFQCELRVPILASLIISARHNVTVESMFCEEIKVETENDIFTKDLRADCINLRSKGGNIKCDGILLGRKCSILTEAKGHITTNKLQGDLLHCKTDKGNISTSSCYVEETKIETNAGNLILKNLHKKAEVVVHNKGDLNMVGFHGNLTLRSNGGTMFINLSELSGENKIIAAGIKDSTINISELIEKTSNINITADQIILDESLNHLNNCIDDSNKIFRYEQDAKNANGSALNIESTDGGIIKLGKASWMDSLGIKTN